MDNIILEVSIEVKRYFWLASKIPKLYVLGCAAALDENGSHYRPPGPAHSTNPGPESSDFFVTYYQKKGCTFGARYATMCNMS